MTKSSEKESSLATARNFAYPYPLLLMLGELNITGEKNSGVKTTSQYINPQPDKYLFIRTSGNVHKNVALRHGYNWSIKEGIQTKVLNGVAKLTHVRELKEDEQLLLFLAFNNLPNDRNSRKLFKGSKSEDALLPPLAFPLLYGLFFEDVRPFRASVPLEIKPGAVNNVKLARSKTLEAAIASVGLTWDNMIEPQ